MWQHFKIFVIQFAALAAVRVFDLGMAYLNAGEGLHPVLAGALSLCLLLFPHVVNETVDEEF